MTTTARRYTSAAARANVQIGAKAETLVAMRLQSLGFACICKIETGWNVVRKVDERTRQSRIVGAHPIRNVAGDLRAIVPVSGRSVLCEVKKRADDALSISCLELHQQTHLRNHHMAGGISLLAWVSKEGIAVMRWPIIGWVSGSPIYWPRACLLNLQAIPERPQPTTPAQ